MPVTNIFEAVLGGKNIKWDAFWHLFEWLLHPDEGHGLGAEIRSELIAFSFASEFKLSMMRREHPVSGQIDGKGKFADLAIAIPTFESPTHLIIMDDISVAQSGAQRKLTNLLAYDSLSAGRYPEAVVRTIVVSDVPVGVRLKDVVYAQLGEEADGYQKLRGWKLLSLQTIAAWIRKALSRPSVTTDARMRASLEELAVWCEGPRTS